MSIDLWSFRSLCVFMLFPELSDHLFELTKKEGLFLFSIEFDRDDELFATAGVSRCIKVFDFSSVSSFTYQLNHLF